MEIPKDLYDYLTNFADDKTILQMISVNKKYNDPEFFEKVMKRKYPLLIEYKKEGESWKEFYLKMIYYIAKIKEKYKIPYIPYEEFNPEDFYRNLDNQSIEDLWKLAKDYAIKSGQLDVVKYIIDNGYKIILNEVSEKERKRYYEILINSDLLTASKKGFLDIVKYLVEEKGANNIDSALKYAIQNQHVNVAIYLKNYL